MKTCPKCGLDHPLNVELCACGHWFKHSNSLNPINPQPNTTNKSTTLSSIVVSSIALFVLFVIGIFAKELGRSSAESVYHGHRVSQTDLDTVAIANGLNSRLPTSASPDMRWDNVVAGNGKTLIFKYTLTHLKSNEIDHQAFNSKMQEIAHAACTSDGSKSLIQDGITLEYRYFGSDDVNIGGISITQSYCLQSGTN